MRRSAGLVAILIAVAACASAPSPSPRSAPPATAPVAPSAPSSSPSSPSSPPASPAAVDRDQRWLDGLADLLPGLERLHPDPFHSTSKAKLQRAVDDLAAAVPSLDEDEVLVGILRIVALVSAKGRDAHTGLYPWGEGTYPVTSLPLRLWLFSDGVHVVDVLPPFEGLVGARIASIDGTAIEDVEATLDPLIPRDNAATVKLLLPRFLLIPQILHGAGVIDDPAHVELELIDATGERRTADVDPIPMADYNAWAGPYGLHLPDDPRVRYLSRAEEPLWLEDLAPGVVYVQYNRVDGVHARDLAAVRTRLGDPDVTTLIVDIRHNYGGELRAIDPVLATLESAPDGVHRWLIAGRNTFSGGSLFAARFTADQGVTVVGEPMGGSPNVWANPRPIELGDTGLVVDVATVFDVGASADDRRLTIEPDVPIELTAEDVAAGRDPVLDTIVAADR